MSHAITITPSIPLTGFDICMELKGVHNKEVKQSFITDLMSHMDDYSYEMVCKFVKENPEPKP